MKDLGVTYDEKLCFDIHVRELLSSAYRTLRFVMRLCRNFENIDTMKQIHFLLVRSKLEYGYLIWNPRFKKYSDLIENCQKRFLKYLDFRITGNYPIHGTQYVYLSDKFEMESLYARRRYVSILSTIKIMKSYIDFESFLAAISIAILAFETRCISYIYIAPTYNPLIYNSKRFFLCKLTNDFLCRYNKKMELFNDSLVTIMRCIREYVSLYD